MIGSIFPILESKGEFLKRFSENLRNQAEALWRDFSGLELLFVAVAVLLGIILAWFYYKPFNEQPGRHYKRKYWAMFLLISFVACFAITLLMECTLIKTHLRSGYWSMYMLSSLNNAVYCALIFFIASCFFCNVGKTNAYPMFKL